MSVVPPQAPGAFNQAKYPGAGDNDDCWVVATCYAMHMYAPQRALPTIPQFRAAAGVPDRPGPTGGTIQNVLTGAAKLWPDIAVNGGVFPTWERFADYMAKGLRPASLQVLNGALPALYQFNFKGQHQVCVVNDDGHWWISNPLQPDGAPPQNISEEDLKKAAVAFSSDHKVRAALFPILPTDAQVIVQLKAQVVTLTAERDFARDQLVIVRTTNTLLTRKIVEAKALAVDITKL